MENKKVNVSLRIDKNTWEEFKKIAKKNGTTGASFLRQKVILEVAKNKKK